MDMLPEQAPDPQPGGYRRGDAVKAVHVLVWATVLLFLVSAGIGVYAYTVNKNRIEDIQASRVSSCEQTYKAFRKVFKPFFPPKAQATPQQLTDQRKFNRRVSLLVHQCDVQTKPPVK